MALLAAAGVLAFKGVRPLACVLLRLLTWKGASGLTCALLNKQKPVWGMI